MNFCIHSLELTIIPSREKEEHFKFSNIVVCLFIDLTIISDKEGRENSIDKVIAENNNIVYC